MKNEDEIEINRVTLHTRPTEGDTYCNDCGLMDCYWPNMPNCPAKQSMLESVYDSD